jgi:hypothetical protein
MVMRELMLVNPESTTRRKHRRKQKRDSFLTQILYMAKINIICLKKIKTLLQFSFFLLIYEDLFLK